MQNYCLKLFTSNKQQSRHANEHRNLVMRRKLSKKQDARHGVNSIYLSKCELLVELDGQEAAGQETDPLSVARVPCIEWTWARRRAYQLAPFA